MVVATGTFWSHYTTLELAVADLIKRNGFNELLDLKGIVDVNVKTKMSMGQSDAATVMVLKLPK